ncbi:AfsR/SARP family transcriptional regulator [Salinispora arenicola]|uniref:AfsR/SARP family transcriptional regulator n=1 Tax=Salinispora arenicola TaxID=168697 RepID=UPI0027DC9767|nr:AfsR/SARP family transcriptional regulator [Salinispora arenicola]
MERLIDVVWPSRPPATARQQVQNCISSLNSRLRDWGHTQTVQRCDSHYSLDVPDESVDERLFRTEYTAAAQLAENGDPAEASMRLRHALRLWRGNALEGIGSDQLVGEATRLDEIRMHSLEQLVNWEFAEGRYHKMIPDLCLWSDTYPHNEHLHARLAEALHHASRTAEALEVLRQLHHRLDRELGIRPGPVVLNLEAQLRRPTPTSAPGSPVDLAALKDIHATLANLTETMQALIKDVPALSRADSHRVSDKVQSHLYLRGAQGT